MSVIPAVGFEASRALLPRFGHIAVIAVIAASLADTSTIALYVELRPPAGVTVQNARNLCSAKVQHHAPDAREPSSQLGVPIQELPLMSRYRKDSAAALIARARSSRRPRRCAPSRRLSCSGSASGADQA